MWLPSLFRLVGWKGGSGKKCAWLTELTGAWTKGLIDSNIFSNYYSLCTWFELLMGTGVGFKDFTPCGITLITADVKVRDLIHSYYYHLKR